MTHGKFVSLAPALAALALAALVLAACGGSSSDAPSFGCPTPFTVQDAGRLTHFKDGPGRDPRDIEYEAAITNSGTTCSLNRGQVAVTLIMRITATAGPSVGAGRTSVPYFVRVLDGAGTVVQGQEFTADFRLSANNPRGSSQEELSLSLSRDGAYRIAIGLKPTPEELNYNRRGRQ
jgi:hypothetical protein